MTAVFAWFDGPLVEHLGWTLVHFVWQGGAVAFVTAVALVALQKRSAHVRYLVALSGMAAMATCPVASLVCLDSAGWTPTRPADVVHTSDKAAMLHQSTVESALTAPSPQQLAQHVSEWREEDSGASFALNDDTGMAPVVGDPAERRGAAGSRVRQRSSRGHALSAADSASGSMGSVLRRRLDPLMPYIVVMWLCGTIVLSTRLLASWCCVERLRRRGTAEVSCEWSEAFHRVCERINVRTRIRVMQSALVRVPAALGWLRPVILLPASGLSGLPTRELEALLAHELAHIRRYDYLINLVQVVVETVLFYHPAMWWLSRRVRAEREYCCDDTALSVCGDRSAFARALLRVADSQQDHTGLALAATGGELTQRVRRVLALPSVRTSLSPSLAGGVILLAAASGLTAAFALGPDAAAPVTVTNQPADERSQAGTPRPGGAVGLGIRISHLISPDGKRVVYGQFVVGPDGRTSSRVIVANADLTDRRALDVALESSHEVLWYRNRLLAISPSHDANKYLVISADNGEQKDTLTLPDRCDVLSKRLSPDGRRVAYAGRYRGDTFNDDVLHGMFVVDLDTQDVKRVLSEAVKTAPAWSPDSTKLAIGAAGGYVKDYPLAIVTADGEFRQLGTNGVGAAFSPDGRFLAFTTAVVQGGSWGHGVPLDGRLGVWDLQREQLTLVSPPAQNEHQEDPPRWEHAGSFAPVWSPDSRRLAYRHMHVVRAAGDAKQQDSVWIVQRDGSGRRQVLDHPADVAWTSDSGALVWAHEGQSGRVDMANLPEIGDTPARPIGPFCVKGRVTDEQGQPLSGVDVRVARGWGTLKVTGTTTDDDGRYEIHFGPGVHMFDDPVMLQNALVSARKAGYYEKTLGEQGRLGMAYRRPGNERETADLFRDFVYPGHPYELNLVMVAAARLEGTLVDPAAKPLANYRLSLDGERLFPASNVLASLKTDENGRFSIEAVPLHPHHFTLSGDRTSISSKPLPFEQARKLTVRLTYDSLAGTLTWEVLDDAAAQPDDRANDETGAVTRDQIRQAVARGAAFLKRLQKASGAWPAEVGRYETGVTALATLAILNCGVEESDPQLALALNWLAEREPDSTYEVALQTLVFCRSDPRKFANLIRRNVEWLQSAQIRDGDNSGMWSYGASVVPRPGGDLSNSGFALWAMDAAAEAGISPDQAVWTRALECLRRSQNADGGWSYLPLPSPSTGSMTCTGIACVAICTDRLAKARGEEPAERIEAVERALRWQAEHFSVEINPGSKAWTLYYLNALQHAARRMNRASIGEHDWYRAGVKFLLRSQHANGHWSSSSGMESDPVVATSLALLFLAPPDFSKPAEQQDARPTNANRDNDSQQNSAQSNRVVDAQGRGIDDV